MQRRCERGVGGRQRRGAGQGPSLPWLAGNAITGGDGTDDAACEHRTAAAAPILPTVTKCTCMDMAEPGQRKADVGTG